MNNLSQGSMKNNHRTLKHTRCDAVRTIQYHLEHKSKLWLHTAVISFGFYLEKCGCPPCVVTSC